MVFYSFVRPHLQANRVLEGRATLASNRVILPRRSNQNVSGRVILLPRTELSTVSFSKTSTNEEVYFQEHS